MLTKEEREGILQIISDASKDAYGFRIRRDYGAMSDDELEATFNGYVRIIENNIDEEQRAKLRCQKNWEEDLAKFQGLGAKSRGDAIRWDIESLGIKMEDVISYRAENYCFERNLDYKLHESIMADLSA